jgi:hypothetical protein
MTGEAHQIQRLVGFVMDAAIVSIGLAGLRCLDENNLPAKGHSDRLGSG